MAKNFAQRAAQQGYLLLQRLKHDQTFYLPTVQIWHDLNQSRNQAAWLMFEHTEISQRFLNTSGLWKTGTFRFSLWLLPRKEVAEPQLLHEESAAVTRQRAQLMSSHAVIEYLQLIANPTWESSTLAAYIAYDCRRHFCTTKKRRKKQTAPVSSIT